MFSACKENGGLRNVCSRLSHLDGTSSTIVIAEFDFQETITGVTYAIGISVNLFFDRFTCEGFSLRISSMDSSGNTDAFLWLKIKATRWRTDLQVTSSTSCRMCQCCEQHDARCTADVSFRLQFPRLLECRNSSDRPHWFHHRWSTDCEGIS